MAYTTEQDLTERFGAAEVLALTDRDGNGTVDAEVLGKAINDAQALVDGYLATRYAVPFSADLVPALVKSITADLVRYRLMENRATEEAEKRNQQAIATLRDLASGKASLNTGPSESAPGAPVSKKGASDRLFTLNSMKGF